MLHNDAIRTGITTSATALVTLLVALAQLSQMNGKLSDVQAKAYYREITNPWISIPGILLLLSASFLIADKSCEGVAWLAIGLFAVGFLFVGFILYQMYRWAMETNSGSMFADTRRSYRCQIVDRMLHKDAALAYSEKLELVERHFETLPKKRQPTEADLLYAVGLSKKIVLRLLKDGVPADGTSSSLNGVHGKSIAEKVQVFRKMRAIRQRTVTYSEAWFDPAFVREVFRLHSLCRDDRRDEYFLLQQFVVEMMSLAGTENDKSRSSVYVPFSDAILAGVKAEVEAKVGEGAAIEGHLFFERSSLIAFMEFLGRLKLRPNQLSLELLSDDDSAWGKYFRGVFRQWILEVVSDSSDQREDAFDSFLAACGRDINRIYFGRLMVIYYAAREGSPHAMLLPRMRRIGIADSHVCAVDPGKDEAELQMEIENSRRNAANLLADRILAPLAGVEQLRDLHRQILEQIATGNPDRIKRLEFSLKILNQRLEYLQSKL